MNLASGEFQTEEGDCIGFTNEYSGTIVYDQVAVPSRPTTIRVLFRPAEPFPDVGGVYEFDRLKYPAIPSIAVKVRRNEGE